MGKGPWMVQNRGSAGPCPRPRTDDKEHLVNAGRRTSGRALRGLAWVASVAALGIGVAACAVVPPGSGPEPAQQSPLSVSSTRADPAVSTPAPGAHDKPSTGGVRFPATASGPLDGRVIVVDPGHNGLWDTSVNAKRVLMYGAGWRPCQNAGTARDKQVTESAIVWDIAQRLTTLLRQQGATVIMTRPDDDGTGPCNNERADIANRNAATMLFSLHVDGSNLPGLRGYHVIWSNNMLGGPAVQDASHELARRFVGEMAQHSQLPVTTAAKDAEGLPLNEINKELGVLNGVGTGPAILAEFGNIWNDADLAILTSDNGKQDLAAALAATAVDMVGDRALATLTPHPTSSGTPSPTPTG